MKKILYLFILIVTISTATDRVVDGDGVIIDSYLTFNQALLAANDGDRIMVAPSALIYEEDILIDKSVSIFPFNEGGHFYLKGNISILLDDVQEFTLVGGWINGIIYAELIDNQRTENTTVNLINCMFYENVYLNKITCNSNIVYCARVFASHNYYGNNQDIISDYINNGSDNIPSILSSHFDFYFHPVYKYESNNLPGQLWTDYFNTVSTLEMSEPFHDIPSIWINNGNVIGSFSNYLFVGDGQDWGNSPIENDGVVNIIAGKFNCIIYNNPSFNYLLSNNVLSYSSDQEFSFIEQNMAAYPNNNTFLTVYEINEYTASINSGFNSDGSPYTSTGGNGSTWSYYLNNKPGPILYYKMGTEMSMRMWHEMRESISFLYEEPLTDLGHAACFFNSSGNASELSYAFLTILNQKNESGENIISNNIFFLDPRKQSIEIDFNGANTNNMTIVNNIFRKEGPPAGSVDDTYGFNISGTFGYSPIWIENYETNELDNSSNGLFANNIVSLNSDSPANVPACNHCFVQDQSEGESVEQSAFSIQNNSFFFRTNSDWIISNGVNKGVPSYRWYDLDLTTNDIGINGGPHSWGMYHERMADGQAHIFWLNLPTLLSNPENFQIKAKGAHLK
tara:strand:+ start:1222 stop:3090 length:1869 start_codon:yes stop_codon:yes gene_type:complete